MVNKNTIILLVAVFGIVCFAVSPAFAYTAKGGHIYDDTGNEIQLSGVNWFGFETSTHVVHGLWERPWRDLVQQISDLGFNAVRIPVCPDTLSSATATSSISSSLNPDLTGLSSLDVLDAVLTELDARGLTFVIDMHNLDCATNSELWYDDFTTEADWIDDLKFLAQRYSTLDHFLGLDIFNEPHGAATWGTGDVLTDWKMAADKAASAIYAINSNITIFVEGIEHSATCSDGSWGWWGGFLQPAACAPLENLHDKIIYSPHVYGPDVYARSEFAAIDFPDNMPARWDADFGFLQDSGATLVIGEWGGKYGHDGGDPDDVIWQDAFADYLIASGLTNQFYWSLNPNSSDTGGILQDDWTTPWDDKLALLARIRESVSSEPMDLVVTRMDVTPATAALLEGTSVALKPDCWNAAGDAIVCGDLTTTMSSEIGTLATTGELTARTPLHTKYCAPLPGYRKPKRSTNANYPCKVSGNATLTTANGISDVVTVSAYSDEAANIRIVAPASITAGDTVQLTALCSVESGTIEVGCGSVSWSGTGVSTDGVLTANTVGTVTISVSRNAYTATKASVTIQVQARVEENDTLVLAFIGDFGSAGINEQAVADLVHSWNTDAIITLGDNNYSIPTFTTQAEYDAAVTNSYETNVGAYYGNDIAQGKFFPALGNHDIDFDDVGGQEAGYYHIRYFGSAIPDSSSLNERYYETLLDNQGLAHLFVLNGDYREPDGRSSTSTQAEWLTQALQESPEMFDIVVLHQPPYSSGEHGSSTTLQWPFRDMGADIVVAGHDHIYERSVVGDLTYLVNGVGGKSLYTADVLSNPYSVFLHTGEYGAVRAILDGAAGTMTWQFVTVDGAVMDETVIAARAKDTITTLIDAGATWSYWDKGSQPASNWMTSDFSDASWSNGASPLGYGETVATTVSYGSSSTQKYTTTYFRTSMSFDGTVYDKMKLRVRRDDGVVIYLNGTEILRSNMPTGTLDYSTKASTALSGSAEETWIELELDPALFATGSNILAAEVHQASSSSSDLYLDLQLLGIMTY